MTAMFVKYRLKLLLSVFSLALVFVGQTWAETTPLEHEKAILVSKFAKYVGWPEQALQSEFMIGVYDDNEKYEYFKAFFANKGVKNKDINVRLITSISDAKTVNILYIPSSKRRILTMAEKAIEGFSVLLMTEKSNDINRIMVDVSFDEEKSNLTFKVNQFNIANASLTLPDLALFVDDNNENILAESPSFKLQKKKENELVELEAKFARQKTILEERLARQQASLIELNKKVSSGQEKSEKYTEDLKESSERLALALEEVTKMSKALESKNEALENLELQLQSLQNSEGKNISNSFSTDAENPVSDENALAQKEMLIELTENLKKQKENCQ